MALKDLLKPTKGGNPATVASIEAKISEAQELVITCQKDANASALEAEDSGTEAAKRAKVARDALINAQNRLSALSGMLHEARERQLLKAEAEDAEQRAKRWKETARLAKQRKKLAIELQVSVENIQAKLQEFLEVNAQQLAACPDLKGGRAGTAVPDLIGSFRLYFVKAGMPWVKPDWVWGVDKIKPLADVIEESNTVMLSAQHRQEVA
jgi:hypothetical protein